MTPTLEILEPVAPHDGLSFDELRGSYNFENISARGLMLTRLVLSVLEGRPRERGLRAIDIGCGRGIELDAGYQWAIRPHVDEYWGLEPDPGITPDRGLFDTYQNADLGSAELPEGRFDVAYSFMVMEHVDDPEGFMRAVYRCLRPGGVYLFATPNSKHYFTRIASLLRKLRLDERVLRMTVGTASDDYHYPVRYRFNSERQIRRTAQAIGFEPPEFAYLEVVGPVEYFPRPLRFVYHGLRAKRRVIRNRRSLITMVCRITKPGAS